MTDPAAERSVGSPEPAASEAAAAAPSPPRWGMGDAALAFLLGMLFAILLDGLYVAVVGRGDTLGFTIVSLVGLWVGLAGVPYLASRRKGSGSLAEDFGFRVTRRDLGIGLLAGVFSNLILINAVVLAFRLIGPDVDVGGQARELTNGAEGWGLAILAPFIGLGAPVVEELFFRGLLQRSIARRLGPAIGVAGSAVAFGFVHLQPDLSGWSQLALSTALGSFGALLSVLTHRAGTLGPAIVAHVVFNTITLVALAAS